MADEITVKLSTLDRPTAPLNPADLVFTSKLDSTNVSYAVTIQALASVINKETVYNDTATGLAAVNEGQYFYAYLDTSKNTLSGYRKVSGAAEPVVDASGNTVVYPSPTFLNALGTVYGFGMLKEVDSFAALRTTPVTTEGQKVRLKGYTSGSLLGGGEFVGHLGTATDDGGYTAAGVGYYWSRVGQDLAAVEMFGAVGDGTTNDTTALLSAVAFATTNKRSMALKNGKSYLYTGSTTLLIDVGKFSFGCFNGNAKIDCSGFTGTNAMNVFSSLTYPTSMYKNTTNRLVGVELAGGLVSGRNGLLIGNTTYDYNGQVVIEHCSFYRFDNVILCTTNTWRIKFIACTVSTGITAVFNAPSGLANSGESITFTDSQISDSNKAPIIVACANFALGFIGCSILNTSVIVSGASSVVSVEGMSNVENPGATAFYRYVSVTGVAARFIMANSTLTCNTPSLQTYELFFVEASSFIIFTNIKFAGNAYKFETDTTYGEGVRKWVAGQGAVFADGCTADIGSGAGNIPIHPSLSPIRNWNFETGSTAGWTINNASSSSQTAVVSTTSVKTGTYGLRLTSISGLSIYATQNFPVRQGKYFMTSFWAKVITAALDGTSNPGNLSVAFYGQDGSTIASYPANIPVGTSDWAVYGAFVQGYVPAGAVSAQLAIRATQGAVVDFDNILFNFC